LAFGAWTFLRAAFFASFGAFFFATFLAIASPL
jgi:hypothetical protein